MTYFGLYKVTNLVNGKMYIGQHVTDNLDDGYMGSGKLIKRALSKYGISNFRKEWLGFYEDEEELNYMERVFVDQTWLDRSDTYNLQIGGGLRQSEAVKFKMRRSHVGKSPWNKNLPKELQPKFGKHCSLLTKHKISMKHKGLKYKNISALKGRKLSDEHKQKDREAMLGLKFWNNGCINVRARECPEGFIAGRIKRRECK